MADNISIVTMNTFLTSYSWQIIKQDSFQHGGDKIRRRKLCLIF